MAPLILRIHSATGKYRVQVEGVAGSTTTIDQLIQMIAKHLQTTQNFLLEDPISRRQLNLFSLPPAAFVSSFATSSFPLSNGMILNASILETGADVKGKGKSAMSSSSSNGIVQPPQKKGKVLSQIKLEPIDEFLLKQPGTIKRGRDQNFCKHGDQAMCEFCLPRQPYDQTYLDAEKIKHMSFHAYLRQILEKNKMVGMKPWDEGFIAPLDVPDYGLTIPCPSGTHGPYPQGICTKCQPGAITLQTQNFRMVDHVEFETPLIIETFLSYWRQSGMQRAGYLYGRYEAYDKVPLGIKAVVVGIYEMGQEAGHDFIQIGGLSPTPGSSPADGGADPLAKNINDVANALGLVKLGVIYTDLTDDGSGKGSVICKRHTDSFFLSSAEIQFSAHMQALCSVPTYYSPGGEFGSRFMTVVITGNEEGGIDFQSYQVSNSAMSMIRAGITEASVDPGLMRVASSTQEKYVPDVFFKYKNSYGIMVQEAASPTFPVEYLLSSHGFPSSPNPTFTSKSTSYVENRILIGNSRTLSSLKGDLASSSSSLLNVFSDFHLLIYLAETGILDDVTMGKICLAVKTKDEKLAMSVREGDSWATLSMILEETEDVRKSGGGTFGGGGGASKAPLDPWACAHCTFTNISGGAFCEMCGLPKD